jgi:hypothetical protein
MHGNESVSNNGNTHVVMVMVVSAKERGGGGGGGGREGEPDGDGGDALPGVDGAAAELPPGLQHNAVQCSAVHTSGEPAGRR